MCRLAAFPPGFPRHDAIDILKHFESNNTDGTGAAWIKNGEFQVEKYPKSLTKILRRRRFLDHMPHNGWTIAHLRAASHGDNKPENTHPFIINNKWAIVHNGIFSEYKIVKLALGNRINFIGDTDSEAAAHLIGTVGPKKFSDVIDYSGVFLALNIRGDLWAIKTSGDLEIQALTQERVLLASEFDHEIFRQSVEGHVGWYHFSETGQYIRHKKNREAFQRYRPPVCSGYPYGSGLPHPDDITPQFPWYYGRGCE